MEQKLERRSRLTSGLSLLPTVPALFIPYGFLKILKQEGSMSLAILREKSEGHWEAAGKAGV